MGGASAGVGGGGAGGGWGVAWAGHLSAALSRGDSARRSQSLISDLRAQAGREHGCQSPNILKWNRAGKMVGGITGSF